jgi:hypothetical protein
MKSFHNVMGSLMGRFESYRKQRSPRRRTGFGPLAEPMEGRIVLSHVTLAAAIAAPHPAQIGPAVPATVQAPPIAVAGQTTPSSAPGSAAPSGLIHLSVPVLAQCTDGPVVGDMADSSDSGTVESNGQIDVQGG